MLASSLLSRVFPFLCFGKVGKDFQINFREGQKFKVSYNAKFTSSVY